MCIRDRDITDQVKFEHDLQEAIKKAEASNKAKTVFLQNMSHELRTPLIGICLLYTSDAADERSSVDLGGRRIIKKKKKQEVRMWGYVLQHK